MAIIARLLLTLLAALAAELGSDATAARGAHTPADVDEAFRLARALGERSR